MMKEIGQKNPLWVLRTGAWVIIRTSLITHKGNSDRSQSWLSALIAQTYFLNAHNVYFCECSNILPFLWGVKLKRRRFSFLFVEDNLKTLAPPESSKQPCGCSQECSGKKVNILSCTEPQIMDDIGKHDTHCMSKMIGKSEPSMSTQKDVFDCT